MAAVKADIVRASWQKTGVDSRGGRATHLRGDCSNLLHGLGTFPGEEPHFHFDWPRLLGYYMGCFGVARTSSRGEPMNLVGPAITCVSNGLQPGILRTGFHAKRTHCAVQNPRYWRKNAGGWPHSRKYEPTSGVGSLGLASLAGVGGDVVVDAGEEPQEGELAAWEGSRAEFFESGRRLTRQFRQGDIAGDPVELIRVGRQMGCWRGSVVGHRSDDTDWDK